MRRLFMNVFEVEQRWRAIGVAAAAMIVLPGMLAVTSVESASASPGSPPLGPSRSKSAAHGNKSYSPERGELENGLEIQNPLEQNFFSHPTRYSNFFYLKREWGEVGVEQIESFIKNSHPFAVEIKLPDQKSDPHVLEVGESLNDSRAITVIQGSPRSPKGRNAMSLPAFKKWVKEWANRNQTVRIRELQAGQDRIQRFIRNKEGTMIGRLLAFLQENPGTWTTSELKDPGGKFEGENIDSSIGNLADGEFIKKVPSGGGGTVAFRALTKKEAEVIARTHPQVRARNFIDEKTIDNIRGVILNEIYNNPIGVEYSKFDFIDKGGRLEGISASVAINALGSLADWGLIRKTEGRAGPGNGPAHKFVAIGDDWTPYS
jgi:hypothetical protein